ncbi:hypothetical protein GWK47_021413 [Chionoecetes opilio]|uniref:Uncharacterized protein n=1 Tax=Chionoecetes opilio TaxID=41210 RepID=A0A8J5CED8_CHIOP|nr:hypothetical protein GWK47_021413 [Chionoecetes opilio]
MNVVSSPQSLACQLISEHHHHHHQHPQHLLCPVPERERHYLGVNVQQVRKRRDYVTDIWMPERQQAKEVEHGGAQSLIPHQLIPHHHSWKLVQSGPDAAFTKRARPGWNGSGWSRLGSMTALARSEENRCMRTTVSGEDEQELPVPLIGPDESGKHHDGRPQDNVKVTSLPPPLSTVKGLVSRVCRFTWNTSLGDALRATTMGHYRSDSSPHPWIRNIPLVFLTCLRAAASQHSRPTCTASTSHQTRTALVQECPGVD